MGDVMVHVPTFYYRVQEIADGKWEIDFSLLELGEEWNKYDGNQLLGAYEGYVNDGKLYSRSGVDSAANIGQSTFKSYARARGNGYTLTTWEQHNVMAILYYAEYGNTNCQATIGSGTDSYQKHTGQTDSLGMADTHAETDGNTMSINFWGLENWWGNKAEWVDNVVVNPSSVNGVWRITDKDGHSRDVQGFASPTGEWAYPKSVVLGQHLDMVGKTLGGSTSSGLCDGQYLGASTSRVVFRSCSYANAFGGVAFADAHYDSSSSVAYIGFTLKLT